uniref:Rad50/SbcC-type AAA domain-containing protein n=1 Tax=viral metagenome TaxID=1070528 RepID=A0A6C0JS90_9ZZZZ
MAATLEIENFRCWEELRLDIALDGCTHISGNSGAGKSTVFEALLWLLYGKLKDVKNKDHDGPTSVSLTIGDLWINRKNSPARFTVIRGNVEVTANEAEEYIVELFGERTYWMSSSYISQGKLCKLLEVSEKEKLAILSWMAFKGEDPKEYQAKIKEEIEKADKELYSAQSKARAKLSCLKTVDRKWKRILKLELTDEEHFLYKSYEDLKSERERGMKELAVYEAHLQEVERSKEARRKILEELAELGEIDTGLDYSSDDLEKYGLKLERLETCAPILKKLETSLVPDVPELDEDEVELLYTQTREYSAYLDSISKYKDLEDRTEVELREEIEKLNSELDVHRVMSSRKQVNSLISQATELESQLEEVKSREVGEKVQLEDIGEKVSAISALKSSLALVKKSRKYRCPSCQTPFHIDSNMELSTKEVDVSALEADLETLQDELSDTKRANKKASETNVAIDKAGLKRERDQTRLETELRSLRKQIGQSVLEEVDESAILSLKEVKSRASTIDRYRKRLKIEKVEKPEYEYKDVANNAKTRAKIREYERELAQIGEVPQDLVSMGSKRIKELVASLKLHSDKVHKYRTKLDRINGVLSKELEAPVCRPTSEVDKDIEEAKRIKVKVGKYKKIVPLHEKYTKYKNKEVELEGRIDDLGRLLEIHKECEYTSLSNIIDSINVEMTSICDRIFKEPISVELRLSRTLANGNEKNSVGFNIIHKGKEYSSIRSLSGGEQDRVSLALTIALHKFKNTGPSILMIDETLSSVEQRIKKRIVKLFKELPSGIKLVSIHDDFSTQLEHSINLDL